MTFRQKTLIIAEMDYKILFSDKRRRLVIKIVFGEVSVLAPVRLNNARGQRLIDEFVAAKAGWIDKKTAEYSHHIARLPGILELQKFYWHGREVLTVISATAKKVTFDGEKLTLPTYLLSDKQTFTKQLKSVFKTEAAAELTVRAQLLAERHGLTFVHCGVMDAKSKWGVCTASKRISLNWRLALIEPRLCDYVILHELCHLKHLDHSRAFWQCLTEMQLDCRDRRKALKEYDFLTQYLHG